MGGKLLRHLAVVGGEGLVARSASVLDLGGEEEDLEEGEGREGTGTDVEFVEGEGLGVRAVGEEWLGWESVEGGRRESSAILLLIAK